MNNLYLIPVLFVAACSQVSSDSSIQTPQPDEQVMCTQDAQQCPDGSWVGRSGPNCEFVCPNDAGK